MKRIVLSLAIVVLLVIEAFPSVKRIASDLKLFGAYKDTTSQPELDKYVWSRLDSLMDVELVDPPYCYDLPPTKWSFSELPNIKMYFFECAPTFFNQINYTAALFNTSDSTIYPFGGYTPKFTQVIRQYLPEIIGKNKQMDLAYLYLNTENIIKSYYILPDIDYYKALWKNAIDNLLFPEMADSLEKIYKTDIAVLEELIIVIDFSEDENERGKYFDIGFYTWDWFSGDVEYWSFLISEEGFQVESSFRKFINTGPCKALGKTFDFKRQYFNKNKSVFKD